MKRLLVFLFMLIAAPAAATPHELYVHAPHYGYLNLRAGPGTDHRVIKQMRHGSEVEVLGHHGKWYRVIHNHKVGWAHSNYFTEAKHRPHRPHKPKGHKPIYEVHAPYDHFLNLRTGPGVSYHVLGRMPHGSKVKILGPRKGRWAKVRHVHSGVRGWAHLSYLVPR